MYIFLRNLLLIAFSTFILIACGQEKKSENSSVNNEKPANVLLSGSKYIVGDSIKIGFAQPASKIEIKLDGKLLVADKSANDSLRINSEKEKTGWHQLIVNGFKVNKEAFSDTLMFELISDIIPEEIKYTVLDKFPHQKTSFTEGLEFYKGELYEGTGEKGKSQLLKIDLKTGSPIKSVSLDPQYFGEGITIVNDKIYQLTWQSGVCFRYNLDFTLEKTFNYYFQGWGLTHRDTTLMMSDGSNKIHFYNTSFEKTGDLEVYDNNGPVRQINELEYVNGYIFANIFETNKIIKIDVATGKVVGFMNIESIIPAEIDFKKDVLNGIAYQDSEDAFYITGKNWPILFKIRLKNSLQKKRLASASK